jgi:hypothetical protein
MKKLNLSLIIFMMLFACNSKQDTENKTQPNKESDTIITKPVTVPAATPPPAESRAPINTETDRIQILKNIDSYLVPVANIPAGSRHGIHGATLSLHNTLEDADFQKAFVEVRILDNEGVEIRTDYLTVQHILPGETKTVNISDAVRGSTIQCKVVKLKSQKLTRNISILVGDRFNDQQ